MRSISSNTLKFALVAVLASSAVRAEAADQQVSTTANAMVQVELTAARDHVDPFNNVTLDALQGMGPNARGVALLTTAVTDAELKRLTDGGVRGVRFSQNPPTVTSTFEMIEPLSSLVR